MVAWFTDGQVLKFSTFFGLKLSHHVFGPAELASKALQAVELNSQEGRLAGSQHC